jgi:hypothetical protein
MAAWARSSALPTRRPRPFSPEEDAGVLVGGGALETDLVTNLGYDDKGRRFISRQSFGIARASYEVVYSDYAYTPMGKLTAFAARVVAKKP